MLAEKKHLFHEFKKQLVKSELYKAKDNLLKQAKENL